MLHERCVYQMHFRGFKVRRNVVLHVLKFMFADVQACTWDDACICMWRPEVDIVSPRSLSASFSEAEPFV